MSETSTCFSLSCGETVDGIVKKCPKCGGRMRTSRQIRILGWVMLAAGLFLILMMGTISWLIGPALLRAMHGQDPEFTGTPDQARMVLELFAIIIVFGFGAAANGLIQIRTGRRNRLVTVLTLVLAAILFAVGYATKQSLS